MLFVQQNSTLNYTISAKIGTIPLSLYWNSLNIRVQVQIRVIKVFQILMQHSRPEKIVGKKFVRGKPYFKVKWEGMGKDQSSWETPAKLKQFKSMVNKYEVKNWGSPLDEKFFDPHIYEAKATILKSKNHDKKKAKQKKRSEKRKVQQQNSETDESQANSNNSEEEQRQIVDKKLHKQEGEELEAMKKNQPKDLSVQIIDLEDHPTPTTQPLNNIHLLVSNYSNNKCQVNEQATNRNQEELLNVEKISDVKDINGGQISEIKNIQAINQTSPKSQFRRDLGLTLIQAEKSQKNERVANSSSKKLTFSNAVYLEIEPAKCINRIAHIYHLEKVHLGNHLYLVQFNDKEMKKMTTKDLIERYPDTFVSFLESKYRAKCSA